jgi:AcrR family transcriptional regulator
MNDVSQADILEAGFAVFTEQGYPAATLDLIAARAGLDLAALQARYADKDAILNALLASYSPLPDLKAALAEIGGDSAEEMIRDTMRRMVTVFDAHQAFLDLAALDVQATNGAFLANLSTDLLPAAYALLERIKETGQLRPTPDPILARTLIALLMGFVLSEKAMPKVARLAMRLFPQRAWIDGMVDLLLYGVLEDDAR